MLLSNPSRKLRSTFSLQMGHFAIMAGSRKIGALGLWKGKSRIRASISGEEGGGLIGEESGLSMSIEVDGMEEAVREDGGRVDIMLGRFSLAVVFSMRSVASLVHSVLILERISGFLNGLFECVVRGVAPSSDKTDDGTINF